MKGILKADPGARFRFWGGDKMAAVGGAENLAMHYEKASFMGFTEVLKNLRDDLRPDRTVQARRGGLRSRRARADRLCRFQPSSAWFGWRERTTVPITTSRRKSGHGISRGAPKKIRRWVDRLFVIFPFEVEYFRRRGIEAIYEGNPLMDAIDARLRLRLARKRSSGPCTGSTDVQSGHAWPAAGARRSATICRSWSSCRGGFRSISSSWRACRGSTARSTSR